MRVGRCRLRVLWLLKELVAVKPGLLLLLCMIHGVLDADLIDAMDMDGVWDRSRLVFAFALF